ncbi:hypothetical protein PILCRDRAFT_1440 [Piloderma croceum F 1598]|uniref:Uncharacterized protein n=1 Tax=Piloderma croceum (strain F 1598) TaxID=765440 RepID=A0A0C3GKZ1_PILCF|nr:hypothetical protein PILCRDRAFT_1440 [Piloderma croceum F 1598]
MSATCKPQANKLRLEVVKSQVDVHYSIFNNVGGDQTIIDHRTYNMVLVRITPLTILCVVIGYCAVVTLKWYLGSRLESPQSRNSKTKDSTYTDVFKLRGYVLYLYLIMMGTEGFSLVHKLESLGDTDSTSSAFSASLLNSASVINDTIKIVLHE